MPIGLADLLLRLAEAKTFRALWSPDVLAELERNLVLKLDVAPVKARKRIDAMRVHFPDALVTGYEGLVEAMVCDPKDRHVLAAAVKSKAELLVTANIRDFPVLSTKPYEIEVVTPDDFLLDQLELFPRDGLGAIEQIIHDYEDPRISTDEWAAVMESSGLPLFAAALRERWA